MMKGHLAHQHRRDIRELGQCDAIIAHSMLRAIGIEQVGQEAINALVEGKQGLKG